MTIAYVGGTLARNGGGDSNGFTSSAFDTTGANFILVSYSSGATSLETLTDSKGNTWTAMTASTASGRQHRFYYAFNATVGTGHTFTITGTATYPSLAITWYSGVQSASDPLDQQARNGQVAPSVTAGPITPTVDGCLIATGFHHADGVNTRTLTGGCTMVLDETSTTFGSDNGSYGHLVSQTTAAAISANWSTTNTVLTESTIASFKPATGAPTGITLVQAIDPASEADTAVTASFGTLPTIGNLIVVAIGMEGQFATATSSVTDNQGHTYTKAVGTTEPAAWVSSLWYTVVTASSGTFTITATNGSTGSAKTAFGAGEFSGASGTVDKSVANSTGGFGAPQSTGNLSGTAAAGALEIATCFDARSGIPLVVDSLSPGYTTVANDATVVALDMSWRKLVSGTNVGSSWTGAGFDWRASAVTFLPGGAAPPVSDLLILPRPILFRR